MSYQKLTTSSYCVAGRHYSGTVGIELDITKSGRKFLVVQYSKCNSEEPMTASDDTKAPSHTQNYP